MWQNNTQSAKNKLLGAAFLRVLGSVATSYYSPLLFNQLLKILAPFEEAQAAVSLNTKLLLMLGAYPSIYLAKESLNYVTSLLIQEAHSNYSKKVFQAGYNNIRSKEVELSEDQYLRVGNRLTTISSCIRGTAETLATNTFSNVLELMVNGWVLMRHLSKGQMATLSGLIASQFMIFKLIKNKKQTLITAADDKRQELNRAIHTSISTQNEPQTPVEQVYEQKIQADQSLNRLNHLSSMSRIVMGIISSSIFSIITTFPEKFNTDDFVIVSNASISFHLTIHFFNDMLTQVTDSFFEYNRLIEETHVQPAKLKTQ